MARRAAWTRRSAAPLAATMTALEDLALAVAGADQGSDVAVGCSLGVADDGVDERGKVGGHLMVVEHGPPDCGVR